MVLTSLSLCLSLYFSLSLGPPEAKQVTELIGGSQSTFSDMVSELGLSAAMRPETQYTLLVPLNGAFNGASNTMP